MEDFAAKDSPDKSAKRRRTGRLIIGSEDEEGHETVRPGCLE